MGDRRERGSSVLAAGPPGSTRLAHSDASAFFPYPGALGFYDGPIGSWGLTAAKGFQVAATAPPGPFVALTDICRVTGRWLLIPCGGGSVRRVGSLTIAQPTRRYAVAQQSSRVTSGVGGVPLADGDRVADDGTELVAGVVEG